MKRILVLLLVAPALAWAAEEGPKLDAAPVNLSDHASLQRGAAIFVNHCLNCHSATAMRYGRLEDLGLTQQQIEQNLLFTTERVGDTMSPPIDPDLYKTAFGVVPPDLSLIARSRSADWLYTYLRSFYRDPNSKTGWNNLVFPSVAMPHVLWKYQGQQKLEISTRIDEVTGDRIETYRLVPGEPGTLSPVAYDRYVGDLVNYLVFMSEPAQETRRMWGVVVLLFLAGFFVLTMLLKKEYWKDVR
ncbi:MAG TPA: cytochrome c1 [Usitatibacter sp.]|nr:cytochrome c1 [Usitatibacter sp.]